MASSRICSVKDAQNQSFSTSNLFHHPSRKGLPVSFVNCTVCFQINCCDCVCFASPEEEYKRLSEALADEGTYNAVAFRYSADYYDPSQPTEEEEAARETGETTPTHTHAAEATDGGEGGVLQFICL